METIEKNGEFERFVIMLTDREERDHRDMRKRDRERRRLSNGDDYVSDDDSEDLKEEDEDDYDDETSEYDSEVRSEMQDVAVSELKTVDGRSSVAHRRKRGTNSNVDDMDLHHRFNPLRFLALNLKSQNETMKPRTANAADTPASAQQRAGATF